MNRAKLARDLLEAIESEFGLNQPREKPIPPHLKPRPNESPADTLSRLLPGVPIPRGDRHTSLWEWAHQLRREIKPQSRVEIWPRGGAKSTQAELIAAYTALSLERRFVLYVSGTQLQADLHIQAIAALLEQIGIKRAVNAYSNSVGWTAQRIQTENGWGAIAVGLDGNIRGARLGQFRPDLIVLDDIDNKNDSESATQKRLRTISTAILPAGSADAGLLFIQNKIHSRSAIARVADGTAGIALGASVTIEPAVTGLEYARVATEEGDRYRIFAGRPTWEEGQSLAICEAQINEWGIRAFLSESQHEDEPDGGIWDKDRDIVPYRVASHPELYRIVIGIDPSGGRANGTETGIVAVGMAANNHAYVLADDSTQGTADTWARAAVDRYNALDADAIIAESNYGGDMVERVIKAEDRRVCVKLVRATRGKVVRAEPIQQKYEKGLVHHVGTFLDLESELCRWQPGMDSPNRLDSLVWSLTELFDRPITNPVARTAPPRPQPGTVTGAIASRRTARGRVR